MGGDFCDVQIGWFSVSIFYCFNFFVFILISPLLVTLLHRVYIGTRTECERGIQKRCECSM